MRIQITAEVSYKSTVFSVDLDELGMTVEEWESLEESERENILQEKCNDLPESPSWVLDSYNLKN